MPTGFLDCSYSIFICTQKFVGFLSPRSPRLVFRCFFFIPLLCKGFPAAHSDFGSRDEDGLTGASHCDASPLVKGAPEKRTTGKSSFFFWTAQALINSLVVNKGFKRKRTGGVALPQPHTNRFILMNGGSLNSSNNNKKNQNKTASVEFGRGPFIYPLRVRDLVLTARTSLFKKGCGLIAESIKLKAHL